MNYTEEYENQTATEQVENRGPRWEQQELTVQRLGGGNKRDLTPAGRRGKWHSPLAQRGHCGLRPADGDPPTIKPKSGRPKVRPSGRARTPGRPGQNDPCERTGRTRARNPSDAKERAEASLPSGASTSAAEVASLVAGAAVPRADPRPCEPGAPTPLGKPARGRAAHATQDSEDLSASAYPPTHTHHRPEGKRGTERSRGAVGLTSGRQTAQLEAAAMFGAAARARAGTRMCASQEAPRLCAAADSGSGCFRSPAAGGTVRGRSPPPSRAWRGLQTRPRPTCVHASLSPNPTRAGRRRQFPGGAVPTFPLIYSPNCLLISIGTHG